MNIRIGHGYDIHALVPGRPFVLGGVTIPSGIGPSGHSDADVLSHAIIDALLGATSHGDIGQLFPDSDETWRDASGALLIGHTLETITDWAIVNIDTTVITETPKIGPYREQIRESLADQLGISVEQIGLKAKTNEGLDAVGRSDAVVCHAVALVAYEPKSDDDTWL